MKIKKNHKISVCFISHFGYPLYNKKCIEHFGGGAEVQLYLLSKQLAKIPNFDINIITGYSKKNISKIEIVKHIKLFKVLPTKRKIFNYFKGFISFFITLMKINPDVVIQRSSSITTGLCALYCVIFKKTFIFSIANEPNVNGDDEKGFFGKFYKYGLENATFIIAQNQDQINKLQLYKKKKILNIKIINSGYKIANETNENRKNILWVGRAVEWKRPEIFIALAQKFPNEKFIMICTKYEDKNYWKSIKSKASEILNLKFIEFVPFHKINDYFKLSKIFINTSKYEGFPNTFIQALKNETPIISLNVNPDNFLIRKKIGFFCNDDFTKLEENLSLLLNNNDLYGSYSKNAYLYAKNNHDIRKISYEWIKLIKQIS